MAQPRRRLTPEQYARARQYYSDEEIQAEGYDLPEMGTNVPKTGADFSNVESGSSSAPVRGRASRIMGAVSQLGGPWGDEAISALGAMGEVMRGRATRAPATYRSAQREIEGSAKEFQKEHPKTSLGLNIIGGLLPAGGALGTAAKLGTRAARVATSAPVVGAATGAAYGAGEGHGMERVKNAAIGGTAGAVLGPVVSGLASGTRAVAGPAVRKLASKLPPRRTTATAVELPTSKRKALELVARKFEQSGKTPDDVADAIMRAQPGDPELLLNVGGRPVQSLARGVQSIPGRGEEVIQAALERQAVEVPELVTRGLEKAIGKKVPSASARIDELEKIAATAAKPHYDALRDVFVDTPAIKDVIRRPDVEDAVRTAQRIILNRGHALPDGMTVGLLDDAKKVLDAKILSIEEAAPGQSRSADKAILESLKDARAALIKAVDDATDDAYKVARETAQPLIRQREAFREGAGALRERGDDLATRVKGQTPEEQALGLEGASTEIMERLTSRDPARAASVFDPKARRNLDILAEQLPQAREAIRGTYERANKLQKQARASTMVGQSATAPVGAVQDEINDAAAHIMNAVQPGGAISFGLKASLVRLLAKAYRAKTRAVLGRGSEEVAGEIADVLTKRLGDPVSQSDVLRLLQQAMTQRAVQQAQKTGRRVAAGAIGGTTGGQIP